MPDIIVSLSHPKLTKVYLRPLEKTDATRCCRWINDPEVRRFLSCQNFLSISQEEDWIEKTSNKGNNITLAIVLKGEHRHIGVMGLQNIDWVNRRATTGAMIGERVFWSKGYGTEAKLLLLKHAFDTLGFEKICSEVLSINPRSKAYLEKTGYRQEGCLKKHFRVNGQMVDAFIMAIFREDFEPVWKKHTGE